MRIENKTSELGEIVNFNYTNSLRTTLHNTSKFPNIRVNRVAARTKSQVLPKLLEDIAKRLMHKINKCNIKKKLTGRKGFKTPTLFVLSRAVKKRNSLLKDLIFPKSKASQVFEK